MNLGRVLRKANMKGKISKCKGRESKMIYRWAHELLGWCPGYIVYYIFFLLGKGQSGEV
jgi:hypothetical protein